MQDFFYSIFGLFLSPGGVLLLAALDASMLFFLPAALDTAVIIMSAQEREWFWAFPLLAMTGSVVGAAVTYYIGGKIGEKGLQHWVSKQRLDGVRRKLGERGAIAMGTAALLPPPFPLTPFVLTSGALNLDRRKFLGALGAMRFMRFGVESLLAEAYGPSIVEWLESDAFKAIISGLMIVALAGTGITIYQIIKRKR